MGATDKTCSRYSTKTTYNKIVRSLRKHYFGSETQSVKYFTVYGAGISGTMSHAVEGRKVSNNSYEIIASSSGPMSSFYGLMIKIKKGNHKRSCRSTVDVRYANSFWKSAHSKTVNNILRQLK